MKGLFISIMLFVNGCVIAQNSQFHSTFQITKFKIDSTQLLWTTIEESGAIPFQIEQYLWGTWTKIGEVMGIGTSSSNTYSFKVNFINGENHFRVLQWGSESGPRLSKPVQYYSTLSNIEFKIERPKITFNRKSLYQLIHEGKVIKKGYGSAFDISDLNNGEYTLNYDSKSEKIKIE